MSNSGGINRPGIPAQSRPQDRAPIHILANLTEAEPRGYFPRQVTQLRADQVNIRDVNEILDMAVLADAMAEQSQTFLNTTTEIAAGEGSEMVFPMLLLGLSQVLAVGAKLGAMQDVVPSQRFEPDSGPDMDADPLRIGLANALDGVDLYGEVLDPLTDAHVTTSHLSDDLADIAADLDHGLHHYQAGRIDEAVWWWQFSYLSTWGMRASTALRTVQAVMQHLRLDVDLDTASEAQFEALHLH